MHEFSIASALIEQVLRAAEENDAVRVDEVCVETGVLRQVVPEVMEAAWEAVRVDTIAAGAELRLEEIGAAARCRSCGAEFEPELDFYVCPKCGQADAEILRGDSIVLKYLECRGAGDV